MQESPLRVIIIHLIKYFKIDVPGENAYPLSIDINRSLSEGMQAGTCAHAQLPPIQLSPQSTCSSSSSTQSYSALLNQMIAMSLSHSADTVKILANQDEFRNTLAYIFSSHHYYPACVDYSFAQHEWPQLMPSYYTHPLPAEGPPFEPWVVPTEPVGMYHLVVDEPDDPLYVDKDFIPDE